MQKTYSELIKEISPEEIDDLYSFFEQFEEKNSLKSKTWLFYWAEMR